MKKMGTEHLTLILRWIGKRFHSVGIALILMATPAFVFSQTPPQKADRQFAEGKYQQAAKAYTDAANKQPSAKNYMQLARCYAALGQTAEAEKAYERAVFSQDHKPADQLEYAQFLKGIGKTSAAAQWFQRVATVSGDSAAAQAWLASCQQFKEMQADSLSYVVKAVPAINSRYHDFAPSLYQNNLVFSTAKTCDRAFRSADANLVTCKRMADGSLQAPKPFGGGIPGGAATFRYKKQEAWATHYAPPDHDKRNPTFGASVIQHLKWVGNKWIADTITGFGAFHEDAAQPALNPLGNILVFAATLPESYGGRDLYYISRMGSRWTEPQNLGPGINSAYDEGFPSFDGSTLYFSSERPEGLGGKDIFAVVDFLGPTAEVVHEGAPLNSPYDDFGVCFTQGTKGYFCSNRPGGKGGVDLWEFTRKKTLDVVVLDANTDQPLPHVQVRLMDANEHLQTYTTNAQGRFRHVWGDEKEVFVELSLPKYQTTRVAMDAHDLLAPDHLRKTIRMEPIVRQLFTGRVTDPENKPIDASIRLLSDVDLQFSADRKGNYERELRPNTQYNAIYSKPGYIPRVLGNFETGRESNPQVFRYDIGLQKGTYLYLEGRALDTEREIAVSGADVRLLNEDLQYALNTQWSMADGMVCMVMPDDRKLSVMVTKRNYFPAQLDLDPATMQSDSVFQDLALVPIMPDKVIKTLHFEYKSSELDAAGKRELRALHYLINSNPDLGLEIRAYTDCRGNAASNLTLSQQRADHLVTVLVAMGMDAMHYRAIGMGEEGLVNHCTDGVPCSEELHAQNRRAEIKLVRLVDMVPAPQSKGK
jgi:outer membrane protein OmpA-like peptidoglycan-associated protein